MIAEILSPDCPVLLVGPPGVGKTACILQCAEHVEVLLTSAMVEEDIAGLPYRDGDREYRTIPSAIRRIIDADAAGKSTILFLDEIDKARRSVADTLLTLVASRRAGHTILPQDTIIVAAANPSDRSGGDGVSEAMRSRFAVVPFVPDPHLWAIWAREYYTSPWSQRLIDAVEIGELPLVDETRTDDELNSRTTCPRTLAFALATIERLGHTPAAMSIIHGLLTPSVVSRFEHYAGHDNILALRTRPITRRAATRASVEPIRLKDPIEIDILPIVDKTRAKTSTSTLKTKKPTIVKARAAISN